MSISNGGNHYTIKHTFSHPLFLFFSNLSIYLSIYLHSRNRYIIMTIQCGVRYIDEDTLGLVDKISYLEISVYLNISDLSGCEVKCN